MITFETFVGEVQHRTGLDSADLAERLSRATLRALAERLPAERREAVAAGLPLPLSEDLHRPGAGHRQFRVRELYNRISRANPGIEPRTVNATARAVISVLRDTLPVDVYDELVDLLPPDYYRLLDWGSAA